MESKALACQSKLDSLIRGHLSCVSSSTHSQPSASVSVSARVERAFAFSTLPTGLELTLPARASLRHTDIWASLQLGAQSTSIL
jgi:hypothetical protein